MFLKCIPVGQLGANCYVICDTETKIGAVIDPGEFDGNVKKAMEISGMKELKYILCTHGHYDHIGGVSEMKKEYPHAVFLLPIKSRRFSCKGSHSPQPSVSRPALRQTDCCTAPRKSRSVRAALHGCPARRYVRRA